MPYPSHIPREPEKPAMGEPNWGAYALAIVGWVVLWIVIAILAYN